LYVVESACDLITPYLPLFKHLKQGQICDMIPNLPTISSFYIYDKTDLKHIQSLRHVDIEVIDIAVDHINVIKMANLPTTSHTIEVADTHLKDVGLATEVIEEFDFMKQKPVVFSEDTAIDWIIRSKGHLVALMLTKSCFGTYNDWSRLSELVVDNHVLQKLDINILVDTGIIDRNKVNVQDESLEFLSLATSITEFGFYGFANAKTSDQIFEFIVSSRDLKAVSIGYGSSMDAKLFFTTVERSVNAMNGCGSNLQRINLQLSTDLKGDPAKRMMLYHLYMDKFVKILKANKNDKVLLNGFLVKDLVDAIEKRDRSEYGGHPRRFDVYFQPAI